MSEHGQELVFLGGRFAQRGFRTGELRRPLADPVLQLVVELGQLARLAIEVGEHRHLVAEHLRVDGLRQVIDRARAITGHHVLVLQHVGAQEHDGRLAEPPRVLDHRGELDAAHAGHLHVHDDGGHVMLQQQAQRGVRVLRPEQTVGGILQDGLEPVEASRLVVDQEDIDRTRHQRCSQTLNNERSWSVLTGLAM